MIRLQLENIGFYTVSSKKSYDKWYDNIAADYFKTVPICPFLVI